MGNTKYVGRVGALAVALGIGTAVVTSPGVAMADPSADSSSAPDSSSSNASPAAESTSKDDAKPAASVATSSEAQTAAHTGVPTADPRSGIVQASGGAHSSRDAEEEPAASTDEDTSAPLSTPEPADAEPADAEPTDAKPATRPEPSAPEQSPVSAAPAPPPATVAHTESSDNDGPAFAHPQTVHLPAADTDIA
ncbi:MAG TPA: hypothetical protein VET27_16135 [Mycobacterium sp.]|nr:hypothetical protein [Mycobacterium sp.]